MLSKYKNFTEENMLPLVRGVYKADYNLSHLIWFKVGGKADLFFKPEDEEDLINFLKENNEKLQVTIIGAGSNIIIRDGGIEGIVIKLGKNFTSIEILPNGNILVGSGCLNFNLAKFAQINGIGGLEFLVGIPGTVGGGVAMNAGAYESEFKDIVHAVHAVDTLGNKKVFSNKEIGFSYRSNSVGSNLIFTKVEFEAKVADAEEIKSKMQQIGLKRAAAQPVTEKTGGSTFANPQGKKAWELIDSVGMRGKKIGDASISEQHCNFMINNGNATARDLEMLGELVKEEVQKATGVQLNWEIKRVGRE